MDDHRPKRRGAAPGVVARVDGVEVTWTPTGYNEPGMIGGNPELVAQIEHAIATRRWAPVLGVLVLAGATTAVGFLAALYAISPSGVHVLAVPEEAVDWLQEQRARAAAPR